VAAEKKVPLVDLTHAASSRRSGSARRFAEMEPRKNARLRKDHTHLHERGAELIAAARPR